MRRRIDRFLRLVGKALVLLVVLEACAAAALFLHGKISPDPDIEDNPPIASDVYDGADWAEQYYREFLESYDTVYSPYTGYRRPGGFEGRYVNTDERGLRRTVPDCSGDAEEPFEVFFLGGSAAWGAGARDEATIPSWLARKLCAMGVPTRVTNFGESGYQSTQDVIVLFMELQAGRVPDLAIFYDSVNDVFSSYQNDAAGLPQNVANRQAAYRVWNSPVLSQLDRLAKLTHLGRVARAAAKRLSERGPAEKNPDLVQETVDLYLRNLEIVRALGERYGFTSLFYWQPSLAAKDVLSEFEQSLPVDPRYQALYREVTPRVARDPRVHDLSGILDPYERSFFIDEYHISEEGNEIVASRMLTDLIRHPALASRLPGSDPSRTGS